MYLGSKMHAQAALERGASRTRVFFGPGILMLANVNVVVPAVLEIFLIFLVLYALLRFLQGTRGAGILRGLMFFIVIALVVMPVLVDWWKMYRLRFLLDTRLLIALVPILILFQPEFRRVLVRVGETPLLGWFFKADAPVVNEIARATHTLSRMKVGALIAIEREVGLGAFIEGGVRLDAEVTSDLLVNVFWPGAPLHDGAVIVRGNRVAAAGCLFPLTENPAVAKSYGTRHRAAIGVTEESDAIAIVVSEETQKIAVAYRGDLTADLDRAGLTRLLNEIAAEMPGHERPGSAVI